jgi:magnesium transporter
VLTLPITALSSVYGMNIIVNDRTDFPHLAVVVVAAMLVLSAVRLALPGQRRGQCSTLFHLGRP